MCCIEVMTVDSIRSTTLQVERDPDAGIVLIHGFGAGTFAWRHIMSKLAQQAQCRVYAFDRPGFGSPLCLPVRIRAQSCAEQEGASA